MAEAKFRLDDVKLKFYLMKYIMVSTSFTNLPPTMSEASLDIFLRPSGDLCFRLCGFRTVYRQTAHDRCTLANTL